MSDSSNPLAAALANLGGALATGDDARELLVGREAVMAAFHISHVTVHEWRNKPWWPSAREGPIRVYADDLDAALQGAGLPGREARAARAANGERPGLRRPQNIQTAPAAPARPARVPGLEAFVDADALAALEAEAEPGTVEGDLATARAVVYRLRGVVSCWRPETLTEPTTARLYGQLVDTLSRALSRVVTLEGQLLSYQERRRQLLPADEACELMAEFVAGLVDNLADIPEEAVDEVKALEIATYERSEIDSETLMDVLGAVVLDFRAKAVAALTERLGELGDGQGVEGSDGGGVGGLEPADDLPPE